MNLGDDFAPKPIDNKNLEHFDKWILHRLNKAIGDVNTFEAESFSWSILCNDLSVGINIANRQTIKTACYVKTLLQVGSFGCDALE